MDGREYARLFVSLLPPGEAWPHETEETSKFDDLIRALSQEPARVEADGLLVLDSLIPDNANTDLDAWERLVGGPDTSLTDAERLARIRGMLRASGEVTLSALQAAFEQLSGDATIILYNRAAPSFAVGESNVGDGVGEQGAFWLVELYDQILTLPFDAEWTVKSGSFNIFDMRFSNVTQDTTAREYQMGAGNEISNPLSAVADDADIYASVWIWPETAGTVEFLLVDKNGDEQIESYYLTAEVWHKLTLRQNVASGSTDPEIVLRPADNMQLHLTWAVAGVTDSALEQRMSALTQLHTRGVFGVKGEYATLLAQDPMEVVY